MTASGRITLDGDVLADAGKKVAVSPDLSARMKVSGQPLDPPPGVVVMLNKPVGVTCSHKEAGGLVYDLLPQRWRRRDPAISTIGRLDKDTSGLLLLTDDGALLHRVISPKALIAKRYRVTLARPLRGDEADIFRKGDLMLEGETKPLLAAGLEVIEPTVGVITILEGRYHQVRRMFAAVGNHVEALHREAIGKLDVPESLTPGRWKLMTEAEIAQVFER